MVHFTLHLLGQFRVSADKTPITNFHSDKARALLAYLALEPQDHARSELAALLWPEIDEKYARHNLRNTLYRLRQTLDEGAPRAADQLITVARKSVCFQTGNATVDVLRFQSLLAGVQAASVSSLNALEEAVAHYQGELLLGFGIADAPAFEEWLLLQRELLHQQAMMALQMLATAHEGAGRYAQAQAVVSRLLRLDPYREGTYQQNMRLLAQMGQTGQALQQLEQLRKTLREEMGLEPSPETLALAEQIVAGQFGQAPEREEAVLSLSPNDALPVTSPQPNSPPYAPPVPSLSTLDLRDIPDPGFFFGRVNEQQQLTKWLLHDRCRVVAILGIGGMGKTSLAAHWVRTITGDQGAGQFEAVLWRSLLNAPPLTELLPPLLQTLSDQQLSETPEGVDEQLRLLVGYLRDKRILLVLDNVESILEPARAGAFRPGYEPYSQLIEWTATLTHQSQLLLTSRERPRGYARLERDSYPVHSLYLTGLDDATSRKLLMQRGVSGGSQDEAMLVKRYSGNPLALKLVADTVDNLFGGHIAEFLSEDSLVFDDIRTVLDQQFSRLTAFEVELLFWLAIEREPTSIPTLRQNILKHPSQSALIEAIRGLERRSLIERRHDGFALQNVVTEYLTDRLIAQVCHEILADQLDLLYKHALLKAQAKEYIRQSQARLIVVPIADTLLNTLGRAGVAGQLRRLLSSLSEQGAHPADYAGGNILNLLVHLEIDLQGFDFSQLTVREAHLQGSSLIDTNFTGVQFVNTVFTNSFGSIFSIAVSADDQRIAAGFDNGEIGLWRLPHVESERLIVGHQRRVRWVAFSPDNRLLVSASLDQTVRLWDVETGNCVQIFRGHQKGLHTAVFSPDGRYIATGGQDHRLCLWDATTGQLLAALHGHTDWINAVAFHPDGQLLASASHDSTIRFWDLQAAVGQPTPHDEPLLDILEGQFRSVTLAFSPDGSLLASAGGDSTIRFWDVQSRRALHTLHGHTGWIRGVAFSPDGSRLASGGTDQLVRVWVVPSGNLVDMLHGHTEEIFALAFTADGKQLISTAGQEISLWDLSNPQRGQAIRSLQGSITPIRCVTFSPDGKWIASGSPQGAIHLWDVADSLVGNQLVYSDAEITARWRVLTGHTGIITACAFSPDSTILASASHDGSIRLWDVASGACFHVLWHSGISRINCIAFTPDGLMMISAGAEGAIHLWRMDEVEGWQLDDILSVATRVIHCLTISADGRLLAHGTADRTVCVWDLTSKELIQRFEDFPQDFWSLTFMPSAPSSEKSGAQAIRLAGGNRSGIIYIWDLAAEDPAQPIRTIHAHDSVLLDLAFGSASGCLASCGEDWSVRLWNADSGAALHTLQGHKQMVSSIDMRFDGQVVVTGGMDGIVKLWDVETGRPLGSLQPRGPYEGMNITGVTGISEAQRASLKALGAVEE
ncbi:MAG: BTAD domain-containing putative transcriptional regulator [Caldilineaceae bacterium]